MFSRTSRRQPGGAVAWKMKPPYDWFKPALRHSAPHRRDRSRSDRLLPNENGGFGCCKPAPPFTGYKSELPGAFPKIAAADLPKPYATRSVDNGPSLVRRPADAWPKASPARSRCSAELPTGTRKPWPEPELRLRRQRGLGSPIRLSERRSQGARPAGRDRAGAAGRRTLSISAPGVFRRAIFAAENGSWNKSVRTR